LTADGSTVYSATGGHVLGFNTATGAQVFDSGAITGVDGTAIGIGQFAGTLFANTNDGRVVEVPLNGAPQIVIASGGSRGDFVTVDPHDGSLLLTQTSTVLRLTGPSLAVTHPIVAMGTSTTLYGQQITHGSGANQGSFTHGLNALTVTGGNGVYTSAQVTGIAGSKGLGTGYVSVTGFNPGTDREVFAMDVLIDGTQATASEIATLVANINSTHSYGYGSSIALASSPVGDAFASLSPSTPYNLFFTFDGLTVGSNNFSFDLSQDPIYGANATVVAVAAIPEPSSLGVWLVISAAVILRRKRTSKFHTQKEDRCD
jgi:hypothetical protein